MCLGQNGFSEGTARLRIPLAGGFGTVYACAYGDACRNRIRCCRAVAWLRRRDRLVLVDDILTIDKPAVFPVNKDRPIFFALAMADVLLTIDRADCGRLLGTLRRKLPEQDWQHVRFLAGMPEIY